MLRWVVAYDIPDDRRRLRIANLLEGYGDRVQYSVFEVIADENQLRRLLDRLTKEIDPETDRVRFYPLCDACFTKIQDAGFAPQKPFDEPDVIIL